MKIIIVGDGAMGCAVKNLAEKMGFSVVGVVGQNLSDSKKSLYDISEKVHCLIDFSHKDNFDMIKEFCVASSTPAVLATTGYDENTEKAVEEFSKKVAVLRSANFSIGVNILDMALKVILPKLKDFDVEIVETHHNLKEDSPSGTAKKLANTIKEIRPNANFVYGRQGMGKRDTKDVGVFSIRGGSEVGRHEVMFFGKDESIFITHTAQSKAVFASGALRAAQWLKDKPKGLYAFEDCLR